MKNLKAKQIAEKYLASLENHVLFYPEAYKVEEDEDNFKIYFRRKYPTHMKGESIIWVNKKTLKAEWIPGK